MRGEPDQHVGAEQLAHLGDGHVVLADVHAVGAGLARDERPVVDDQERAEALAQRVRGVGDGGQLFVAELLVAQLHDLHAAGDRGVQHVGQRAPAGVGVADEVEPRGGQPLAALGAEVC